MIVYVTRKEEFCAAHKLWNEAWPPEKNIEVFGACANPHWHGHNYTLFVTVKGKVNKETGFVIDVKKLKEIIHEKIISQVDHKNLNTEVWFMRNKITTTENLCVAIWEVLEEELEKLGVHLHCIKICETDRNIFEYYGEKDI